MKCQPNTNHRKLKKYIVDEYFAVQEYPESIMSFKCVGRKKCKHMMIFSENCAKSLRTLGYQVNKRFPCSPSPYSAAKARNACTVMGFAMIIAQVNLFRAVTPDGEISLSYMS